MRCARPAGPLRTADGWAVWLAGDPWYALGVILVETVLRLAYRWRLVGLDNIPRTGPAVLAANHVSGVDPFALSLATIDRRRTVRYVGGAEFFRWPVARFLVRRLRMVPIHRGFHDQAALETAGRVLARGELMGIFPEGRVGDGVVLQRGHSGAARLALAARVPVVPAGIWGTQRRWPRSGLLLRGPLRPRATESAPLRLSSGSTGHRPTSA